MPHQKIGTLALPIVIGMVQSITLTDYYETLAFPIIPIAIADWDGSRGNFEIIIRTLALPIAIGMVHEITLKLIIGTLALPIVIGMVHEVTLKLLLER